eukprot:6186445-Pleurochrysis_carterae.AAC.3
MAADSDCLTLRFHAALVATPVTQRDAQISIEQFEQRNLQHLISCAGDDSMHRLNTGNKSSCSLEEVLMDECDATVSESGKLHRSVGVVHGGIGVEVHSLKDGRAPLLLVRVGKCIDQMQTSSIAAKCAKAIISSCALPIDLCCVTLRLQVLIPRRRRAEVTDSPLKSFLVGCSAAAQVRCAPAWLA